MKKKHKIFIIVGTILLSIIIVAGFVISENTVSLLDIASIHKNMSYDEVVSKIGEPHAAWGGYQREVYFTVEGFAVEMIFQPDGLSNIYITSIKSFLEMHKDDESFGFYFERHCL